MKSLLKLGLIRVGGFTISSLTMIKDLFSLGPHSNLTFFLIMSCRGFIILEKLWTNPRTKFIFPRKDYIDFLLCGNKILEMASIVSSSTLSLTLIPRILEDFLHLLQKWTSQYLEKCHIFCIYQIFSRVDENDIFYYLKTH